MADTRYSINVHTDADTEIKCGALGIHDREVVSFDDMSVFLYTADLRRLADAINMRLAVIDAPAAQVAA